MSINPLMFREYDIRGLVDQDLSEAVLEVLGKAFGTWILNQAPGAGGDAAVRGSRGAGTSPSAPPGSRSPAPTVAVGRDVRLSSPRFAAAFERGLLSTGVSVISIGEVPTPVLYFAVNRLAVDGGACITASHNPPQYNGLKLRRRPDPAASGLPLASQDLQEVLRLAEAGRFAAGEGTCEPRPVVDDYVAYARGQVRLARPLRVVVDGGNGVAGPVAVRLLHEIGCEVIPLYCDPDGTFPHHIPDPLKPENLQDLVASVRETRAELGIALDGDGDRLGVVDDQGEVLWPDQYLILLARNVLRDASSAGKPKIIFDVKSSMALQEEISRLGGTPVMGRTGYTNIMAMRAREGALLAGELSGHIFFNDPVIDFDDASFAAAKLLEAVVSEVPAGNRLSDLVATLPHYHATPEERFYCPDADKFRVVDELRAQLKREHETIDIDGVRALFDGGWGLVRASNTEPALTARFEARTPERLQEIRTDVLDRLRQFPSVDLTKSGH